MSSVDRPAPVSLHGNSYSCPPLPNPPSWTSKDTLCGLRPCVAGKAVGMWNSHLPRHCVSSHREVSSPNDPRLPFASEDIFLSFCLNTVTSKPPTCFATCESVEGIWPRMLSAWVTGKVKIFLFVSLFKALKLFQDHIRYLRSNPFVASESRYYSPFHPSIYLYFKITQADRSLC